MTPIPTARLEEIRELAGKATPGERTVVAADSVVHVRVDGDRLLTIGRVSYWERHTSADMADAEYIATADPQTITAIVSELIERRASRAPDPSIAVLVEALRYARPLLVKYAYTQGNRADFVREITAPVDAALSAIEAAK